MKSLEEVYAGDSTVVIIETVEVQSAGQPSIYLCNGFDDQILWVNELGAYKTFVQANISVKPMDRDSTASQSVDLILANVVGDVQLFVDTANENGAEIKLHFRTYLSDDKSRQASNTLTASAKTVRIDGMNVLVKAGFFDTLSTNFNRIIYNSETAPCLRYM